MFEENDDVIAVEVSSEIDNMENKKPLMGLLNRLIGNSKKQNTVLTNAQISLILEKEFDVTVSSLHSLEQVVYMNVVKKFLKLWPLWDEFDSKIKVLKQNKDKEGIKKLLESKHHSLNTYIKTMLDVSEPLVKQTIKDIEEKEKLATPVKDSDCVIMELLCSRSQLNTLFNNRPTEDGAMFNLTPIEPSRISISQITYRNLLNWWSFSVNITINSIQIRRETCHELKHVLVNKKRFVPEPNEPLNKCFQEKQMVTKLNLSKKDLFKELQELKEKSYNTDITNLLNNILNDLKEAPSALRVPGVYRQHMSVYPYVRYLCTEVDVDPNSEEAKKFDIQLQETIAPMFQLWLGKISPSNSKASVNEIFVECKDCKLKFCGRDMLTALEQHFLQVHNMNEPNWICVHCKISFPMTQLTEQRWRHTC